MATTSAATLLFLLLVVFPFASTTRADLNILFLVADDMRPEMNVTGGRAITPNMDKFAASPGAIVFERAYVSQAICCPSRSSFLTSRRPDTTKVWDLKTYWRNAGGNFTTLPETFKTNGYWTVGMGKVFHPGYKDDAPYSWSEPYFHATDGGISSNLSGACFNPLNVDDDDVMDGKLARQAQMRLSQAQSRTDPFFIAVGLHRPHLPWNVPSHWYDVYDPNSIELPQNRSMPVNYGSAQPWSWDPQSGPRHCGYMREQSNREKPALGQYAVVPDDLLLKFRRAYYSSVSATDRNFGLVLDSLDALNMSDNTIVMLIGDHGWQLGDLGETGKKTNFERATRAPMILRVPRALQSQFPALFDKEPGHVIRSSSLVEFVDIMPTLLDLAGVAELATCPQNSSASLLCTEGRSLRPALQNPACTTFKSAVFMQYAHCMHDEMIWHDACNNASEPLVMGYAVRTRQWRYVKWVGFDHTTTPPTIHWNQTYGEELYDHTEADTVENFAEAENVADRFPAVVEELSSLLEQGWRAVPSDGEC